MSLSYILSIVDYKKPSNIDLGSITDYISTVLANDGNLDPADILQPTCQCVAGKSERAACKHIAALCFALLDYDENKLYKACTERLQQWHQPTRKSSKPVNILDINFISLKHNKEKNDEPKYLKFLKTDIHIPEVTTTLRQLLIKYYQQSTAAASILLPKHVTDGRIPLPARVINQHSLSLSLKENLTCVCFT